MLQLYKPRLIIAITLMLLGWGGWSEQGPNHDCDKCVNYCISNPHTDPNKDKGWLDCAPSDVNCKRTFCKQFWCTGNNDGQGSYANAC